MSILVIGGTGFIGPRLMKRLVARGQDVVCMDLNPSSPSLAEGRGARAVIRGDVTSSRTSCARLEVKPERLSNSRTGSAPARATRTRSCAGILG